MSESASVLSLKSRQQSGQSGPPGSSSVSPRSGLSGVLSGLATPEEPTSSLPQKSISKSRAWEKKRSTIPTGCDDLLPLAACDSVTVRRNLAVEYMYRYTVINSSGATLFHASEEDVVYCDNTDARKRLFHLQVTDLEDNIIIETKRKMHSVRSYNLLSCGHFCKLQFENIKDNMRVALLCGIDGENAGLLRQKHNFGRPLYHLTCRDKNTIYVIRGNWQRRNPLFCNFDITLNKEKEPIGLIKPIPAKDMDRSGMGSVLIASYEIVFPDVMSMEHKAILLAGSFLINCMFFSPRIDTRLTTFYDDEPVKAQERALDMLYYDY